MSKEIRKIAGRFMKQYAITNVDCSALKDVAAKLGYTIVEFNRLFNDEDVETVIKNLGLEEAVRQSSGLTYTSQDYRLIFINEDLNDDEKMLVLSHELGHIVCAHFTTVPVLGQDVKEEHEANEFSHYLLNQKTFCRARIFLQRHKKTSLIAVLSVLAILVIVVGCIAKNREQSYYGAFYITMTGNRYHQRECIHIKNNADGTIRRLTKEQFETGEYEPCGTCLPQE